MRLTLGTAVFMPQGFANQPKWGNYLHLSKGAPPPMRPVRRVYRRFFGASLSRACSPPGCAMIHCANGVDPKPHMRVLNCVLPRRTTVLVDRPPPVQACVRCGRRQRGLDLPDPPDDRRSKGNGPVGPHGRDDRREPQFLCAVLRDRRASGRPQNLGGARGVYLFPERANSISDHGPQQQHRALCSNGAIRM